MWSLVKIRFKWSLEKFIFKNFVHSEAVASGPLKNVFIAHSNATKTMPQAFVVFEKSYILYINNAFWPPQKFTFWALAQNFLTTRVSSRT